MPDERLRAAADNWPCAAHVSDCSSGGCDECKRFREFWDSAMREAAGLVCFACKDSSKWKPATKDAEFGGWTHKRIDAPGEVDCDAGPIQERLAQK